ncbi:MAG: hypothetical protein J1D77_07805 [Muribaculaceae bacterium]|nr:hypothetical protein [Muribaculaceae bacterium]
MINSFFSDSQTEAYMKLVAACFPYVTIGFLGHPVLTIAAGCLGGVALIAFFIRIAVLFNKEPKRNPVLDHIVHGLFFPYAFSLAFAAGIAFDHPNSKYAFGWFGIWFCLFLALFIVIGNLVVAKAEKN